MLGRFIECEIGYKVIMYIGIFYLICKGGK